MILYWNDLRFPPGFRGVAENLLGIQAMVHPALDAKEEHGWG